MLNIRNFLRDKKFFSLHKQQSGFTLIEIMVVVVIFGVLLAIAIPSYQQHVRKSKRADAKAMLLDLAARQERFFSTQNAYTPTLANLGYTAPFPLQVPNATQPNYTVNIVAANATTFSARAVPTGSQATDPCGTYTINHLGVQAVTGGTMTAAQCW